MTTPLGGRHPDEQGRFIEEAGLIFEEAGLPRMAGRVLGRLLICDPPHQSARQLAETLQASAGSISSVTRALTQYGLIERVALPGERRTYFRIRPGNWIELVKDRLYVARRLVALAERGLSLVDQEAARQQRLIEVRDIYAFAAEVSEELVARWERSREALAP